MASDTQGKINPWVVGAKHVLNGALSIAVPAALAFAIIPIGAAALTSVVSWSAAATVAKVGIGSAIAWGGGLGAAFGAIKSLTGIDDAIKMAEQDKMFMEQQKLTFAQKQMLMAQQQQMAMGQGGAVMPNVPYQQQNQRVAGV